MPGALPEHLQHVVSSEDRLHADVPNARPLPIRGAFDPPLDSEPEQDELAAADEERLFIAAAMLGVDEVDEVKLTCKAGTVVLVHHDLFHRATRRLPEIWRPLFVLRDAVRMTEPVAGSTALRGAPAELPACEPSDAPLAALTQRSPEVERLHRTFWRYLIGEGEERAGSADDQRQWEPEPPPDAASMAALLATVTDERAADIDRVAASYAIGRSQTEEAIETLVGLLSHPHESARRAAGYGLTVGGAAAVEALLPLLAQPPTVPPRSPPVARNIDDQASIIPPIAHAISQLAAHAVSVTAVNALLAASRRAKAEIEDFATRVHYVPDTDDAPYEYYVVQRRRACVETNFVSASPNPSSAQQQHLTVVTCMVSADRLSRWLAGDRRSGTSGRLLRRGTTGRCAPPRARRCWRRPALRPSRARCTAAT